mmetsp:Transcript_72188/g.150818  ORF Transcript_72188/g.150818 Transcript_72188/m.150818 type:complete len:246 (-) Transcript_72188:17-754(-)
MLYASSFVTSEVYGAMVDDTGSHWRWFRVVGPGGGGVGLDGATGLAVDDKLRIYVASFATDQVFRYDSVTGEFVDIFINDDHNRIDCPEGLLLLPDKMLVASFLNDRILSYSLDGSFIEVLGQGWHLDGPQTMLLHPLTNSLFVTSYHRDEVAVLDANTGKKSAFFGGNQLSRPVGLAAAPGDHVLVSSHKTNEVLRYNASSGEFVDIFAAGHGLWAPTGLAMTTDLVLFVGTFMDGLRRYSYWR